MRPFIIASVLASCSLFSLEVPRDTPDWEVIGEQILSKSQHLIKTRYDGGEWVYEGKIGEYNFFIFNRNGEKEGLIVAGNVVLKSWKLKEQDKDPLFTEDFYFDNAIVRCVRCEGEYMFAILAKVKP